MSEYITDNIEISPDSDREDSQKRNFQWRKFWWKKLSILSISSDFELFIKYLYHLHNLHESYGKVNF